MMKYEIATGGLASSLAMTAEGHSEERSDEAIPIGASVRPRRSEIASPLYTF